MRKLKEESKQTQQSLIKQMKDSSKESIVFPNQKETEIEFEFGEDGDQLGKELDVKMMQEEEKDETVTNVRK